MGTIDAPVAREETTPYDEFMRAIGGIPRPRDRPFYLSWEFYERLKDEFTSKCPDATPAQYQAAMRAAARAAGV